MTQMNHKIDDMHFQNEGSFEWTDIYAVPVSGSFLLCSPRRAISALVNRKAIEYIIERPSGKGKAGPEADKLQNLFDSLSRPLSAIPSERKGPINPAFLGIIPTRRCNLSCLYCDFGAGKASDDQMDLRMAAKAVDWIAETAYHLRQDAFEVHFFGGEPFAGQEVIEVAVHRSRALAQGMGMAARFEVATNGVFSDDVACFVGHYFDTAVLSFDGPEEVHDRNRPGKRSQGSFARVARTASLLSRSPVDLCFRMCVTRESVGKMETIARWFVETFQPLIINFETLEPTSESNEAGLRPPDPYDFAEHYVRSRRVLKDLGIHAVYASAVTGEIRHSFCPVGKDAAILSPDGRVSSCYLFRKSWEKRGLDMDIGRFADDGTMHLNMESIGKLRSLVKDKPRCECCFCRWTCAGGCHVNHSYPGSPLQRTDFCIQTRIITACSLLDDLGMEQEMEKLLSDRATMEALALAPSDRLNDTNIGRG